jgi:hypothetical protein
MKEELIHKLGLLEDGILWYLAQVRYTIKDIIKDGHTTEPMEKEVLTISNLIMKPRFNRELKRLFKQTRFL